MLFMLMPGDEANRHIGRQPKVDGGNGNDKLIFNCMYKFLCYSSDLA